MPGGMAGAPADLAASYAAVQGNLRKQFFNDLVDLRSALLNTMHAAPPDRTHKNGRALGPAMNCRHRAKRPGLTCRP